MFFNEKYHEGCREREFEIPGLWFNARGTITPRTKHVIKVILIDTHFLKTLMQELLRRLTPLCMTHMHLGFV